MGDRYKCGTCGEEYTRDQGLNFRWVTLKPYEAGAVMQGVEYPEGRPQQTEKELHECPVCGRTNSYFRTPTHERRKPAVGVGMGEGTARARHGR